MRFKVKLYPCQEISKNMWHTSYTHVTHGDFWLLMVGSQIDTLTPDPSFSYNLCYNYSNGSCKPILNIQVLKYFQCYREIFNQINFDPSNCSLKIQKSIATLTPKVGVHLGMCGLIPSHFPALSGVWMWLPGCTLGSHLSMALFCKVITSFTKFWWVLVFCSCERCWFVVLYNHDGNNNATNRSTKFALKVFYY